MSRTRNSSRASFFWATTKIGSTAFGGERDSEFDSESDSESDVESDAESAAEPSDLGLSMGLREEGEVVLCTKKRAM